MHLQLLAQLTKPQTVTVPVRGIRLHHKGEAAVPFGLAVTVPVRGIRLHQEKEQPLRGSRTLLSP